jgi:molybdopterin-guanine dinucleotide biosynthesis protein A
VDDIVISANRNLDVYAGYAWPVVADAAADFAGPLAGVLAGAGRARHDWLLVAPCDTPFLPECLAAAMLARARAVGVSLVRAAAPDRTHYAIMLLHRRLLPDLDRWLAGGARRVQAWQDGHGHADALFEQPPWAFLNINTEADLHRAEAYLTV